MNNTNANKHRLSLKTHREGQFKGGDNETAVRVKHSPHWPQFDNVNYRTNVLLVLPQTVQMNWIRSTTEMNAQMLHLYRTTWGALWACWVQLILLISLLLWNCSNETLIPIIIPFPPRLQCRRELSAAGLPCRHHAVHPGLLRLWRGLEHRYLRSPAPQDGAQHGRVPGWVTAQRTNQVALHGMVFTLKNQ